jgi:hypothetical protein
MSRAAAVAIVLGLLGAAPAAAQELELGGEVRPRFEVRDPVPDLVSENGDGTYAFTSMRSRVSLLATLRDDIRAFVQLQDVRVWGTESGTTDGSAEALDLHQGWVELGNPESGSWAVKAGRQELAYGGQRLVGALNWAQQARSFDGARLRLRPSERVWVDGVAMTIGDADSGAEQDEALYGLYATLRPDAGPLAGSFEGYVLASPIDEPTVAGRVEIDRELYTLGGRWAADDGAVRWRVEAAYQTGEWRMEDPDGSVPPAETGISAYLLAGRIGARVADALWLDLWYDRLSGDDDAADDDVKVFDTLFATNHKFYGQMDLFLNIPVHTAGRGLQDAALKSSWGVADDVTLTGDLHGFWVAASDGLDSGHIGEELDLGLAWRYAPGVSVTGGLSHFWAADAWSAINGARPGGNQVWGYLMLDVLF